MRRLAVLLGAAVASVGLAACSGSDPDRPGGSAAGPADGSPVVAQPGAPAGPTTAAPMPSAPPPETGVPGLDSDDAFCAAWSRYAGSYQVIAVASFFLADQPQRVFELEVAAADTVSSAFAQMESAWPAELEPERDASLMKAFHPFASRANTAAQLLNEAGADPADVAAISAAWVDALAARDPENPDLALQLGDAEAELVRAAAVEFAAVTPRIPDDRTLVIEVDTPRTDAYVAATCPDQGQLAGNDVTG